MKKKVLPAFLIVLISGIIVGCGGEKSEKPSYREIKNYSIFPTHGSLFGNYPIRITIPSWKSFSDNFVSEIRVGPNIMYRFTFKNGVIEGYTQGSPEPGFVDIIITTREGIYRIKNGFKFDELRYPLFKNMVAVGASYTQGWISMGLRYDFQLHSPFSYLAKQAGAYFPNGLVKPGILDGISPYTYTKGCTVTSWITPIASKMLEAMKLMEGKGKNKFFLANYRYDPDILPHNLGIGGNTISDTIEGAGHGRMGILTVFEHLSYDPYVNLTDALNDPISGGPFKTAMSLHPTVLFSTDLFADDILYFAPMSPHPSVENVTPVGDVRRELRKMFRILKENNVEAFIANLPQITVMPVFRLFKNFYISLGYSQEEVDRWEEEVNRIAAEYSIAFTEEASRYPNIHIVDFRGIIEKIMDTDNYYTFPGTVTLGHGGITVKGKFYPIDFLGGLVSLDAIHLTYTGYALLANMFIEKVNEDLHYNIPFVDIEKVVQNDPLSPEHLEELGIDLNLCREEFFSPIFKK